MSQNDIRMYKELLELLEKRMNEGDIDKASYVELKERYTQKLEQTRQEFEFRKDAPNIKVSGSKTFTQDSVTVSGAATISGGKIERDIRISGSGKISGDVECRALRCSGAVKAYGNVLAHGEVKSSGSFRCDKDLNVGENASFSGSAKIFGKTSVQGHLSVTGSFRGAKNTEAVRGATLTGSTVIEGDLFSENAIKIGGKARVLKNILCDSVLIEGRRTVFESFFFRRAKKLVTVEGSIIAHSEVDIQDVRVLKNIKARTVKLGPNTLVEGTVYYVEDLFLADSVRLNKEPKKISQEEIKL
jgi:cytoskeletal protein CcmA (bactofilin family)